MRLSVLMPVYNEIRTIKTISDRVLAQPFDIELVIVDDGSTDGTRDVLKSLAAADKRIRVFFQERNQGKGAAIKEAYKQATGEFCIVQDADLEYDPQDFAMMLELLIANKADVTYGSRFLSRSRVLNYHHYLGNKFINTVANVFFNATFTDLETGYKAFRRDVLADMAFESKTFGFEVEITAHVIKKKMRVFEVPISYFGRTYEEGKKITWKDGFEALFLIVKYRLFKPWR